jgi:hypothetical protein
MPTKQTTEIHVPPNKLRIENIWAYVSVDENGMEGVCAVNVGGTWIPLIAADPERLESLRSMALTLAALTPNRKIRLIKLTSREEIETI